jgi:hypothetical protein
MKARIAFESLESRQLASVSPGVLLGTNLLVDGNAENAEGATTPDMVLTVPGWKVNGNFTIVEYDSAGFPDHGTPGSDDRGRNFFAGGKSDATHRTSSATQDVAVASLATDIDAGRIKYDFSGWLGGYKKEGDEVEMRIAFFNTTNPPDKTGGWLVAHGPDAADRQNLTAFAQRSMSGTVPAGTRTIRVGMFTTYHNGAYIDGYADDMSLTLASNAKPGTGFVSGTVFNDVDGDLRKSSKEKGLAGATVFVDKDNDRKLDTDEPRATTEATGAYTLANVPKGRAVVRMIVPTGFRASLSAVQSLRVNAGLTTIADPFAGTQTALITGKVVWQPAANDVSARPFRGGAVFIDLNHNGKFDLTDRGSMLDDEGQFQLTAPRGAYTILVDQTEGVSPLNVRVGKAQVSTGHVITVPPQ